MKRTNIEIAKGLGMDERTFYRHLKQGDPNVLAALRAEATWRNHDELGQLSQILERVELAFKRSAPKLAGDAKGLADAIEELLVEARRISGRPESDWATDPLAGIDWSAVLSDIQNENQNRL